MCRRACCSDWCKTTRTAVVINTVSIPVSIGGSKMTSAGTVCPRAKSPSAMRCPVHLGETACLWSQGVQFPRTKSYCGWQISRLPLSLHIHGPSYRLYRNQEEAGGSYRSCKGGPSLPSTHLVSRYNQGPSISVSLRQAFQHGLQVPLLPRGPDLSRRV